MSKSAVLQRVLDKARRDERHHTLAETRYWCDQYKQIASEAVKALTEQQIPAQPLTDKMIFVAARVMNDRQADACNVDRDDQWKVYGQDFIDDARAMLEAAHGIKENT